MRKRFDGLFRLRFLNVAEHRVDDEYEHDDDGVERQYFTAFRSGCRIGPFDEPCDKRDGGGGQQQVYERVSELGQEFLPFRYGRCGGEFVRPEFRKPPFGLRLAQAHIRIDIERVRHGLRIGQ